MNTCAGICCTCAETERVKETEKQTENNHTFLIHLTGDELTTHAGEVGVETVSSGSQMHLLWSKKEKTCQSHHVNNHLYAVSRSPGPRCDLDLKNQTVAEKLEGRLWHWKSLFRAPLEGARSQRRDGVFCQGVFLKWASNGVPIHSVANCRLIVACKGRTTELPSYKAEFGGYSKRWYWSNIQCQHCTEYWVSDGYWAEMLHCGL